MSFLSIPAKKQKAGIVTSCFLLYLQNIGCASAIFCEQAPNDCIRLSLYLQNNPKSEQTYLVMIKDLLQKNILEAIREKVPNRSTLVNIFVDLLCIEKEAIYRRLRGEVPFTFAEMALISNSLGISLDNIISTSLSLKSRPFQLKLVNYFDPNESDYIMMEQYLDILRDGKDDPASELFDCTNILPPHIYAGYKYIERLHLFKSIYQSGDTNTVYSFKEVQYNERMDKLFRENIWLTKHIKTSYYIFDPFIFQYIVNDIVYFSSINMIEEDDKQKLKEELIHLIKDMEILAVNGMDKDTGNKVYLYYGSINFNLSYWYLEINNYRISLIKTFVLNNFSSLDNESFNILKQRISALLRSSTMISVSGERQRKLFFDRQREIINTL